MALLDFFKKKRSGQDRTKSRREESFDKKEVKAEEKKEGPTGFAEKNVSSDKAFQVLVSPHVTEKATFTSENGGYVFKVADRANKTQVSEAIEELYGVKVRRVNMMAARNKNRFSRGRVGVHSGYKKAVVFLKPGEKIEII